MTDELIIPTFRSSAPPTYPQRDIHMFYAGFGRWHWMVVFYDERHTLQSSKPTFGYARTYEMAALVALQWLFDQAVAS